MFIGTKIQKLLDFGTPFANKLIKQTKTNNLIPLSKMKKLILSMMLLASVGMATAQNYSDKAYREQLRAQREQVFEQKMKAALIAENFTFNANFIQANLYNPIPISYPNNYMTFYPKFMELDLPYMAYLQVIPTPRILDITTSNYTYTLSETPDYWIVVTNLDNVINGASMTAFQSVSYAIHLSVAKKTGSAVLTITPNMSSAVTYTGYITTH